MESTNPVSAALADTAAPKAPAKTTKAKPAKKVVKAAKPTKPAPKAAAKAEKRDDGRITLKEICAKAKLDPKAARVKLRRNADKLSFHDRTERWTFTQAQAARVREILAA